MNMSVETPMTEEYTTKGDTWRDDNGNGLAVAINAVENGAEKPPLSTIAGIRTAPKAATVAGPEPEIAPKKQATMMHTFAMPPLRCAYECVNETDQSGEIPAFAIMFPDNTKNGIASRNLLIPE